MKVICRRLGVDFGVTLWVLLASAGMGIAQSATTSVKYDVIVAANIMVPMRDGVQLATDVYLPARNGAVAPGEFPVLVSRTPYGKEPASAAPDRETSRAISPSSAMSSWCRIAEAVTTRREHSIST